MRNGVTCVASVNNTASERDSILWPCAVAYDGVWPRLWIAGSRGGGILHLVLLADPQMTGMPSAALHYLVVYAAKQHTDQHRRIQPETHIPPNGLCTNDAEAAQACNAATQKCHRQCFGHPQLDFRSSFCEFVCFTAREQQDK